MNARLPTLTVVIPCFNAIAFVCNAIESVLAQSDNDVECIVVDDGSTDGSAALVRERYSARVTLIQQSNAGVAAARNRGLAASRSELIAWLDADDVLAPGTLDRRRRAFAENPDLDMLAGQVEIVNVDTSVREVSPLRCESNYLVRDLLARTNLPHTDVLMFRRRAVAALGGYDIKLKVVDDFDLWIRAWASLRWSFVPEILAVQRTGSYPSLSRSESKVFIYEQVGAVLRKNRALLRRTIGSDDAWRRGYSRFAADFALIHLNRGERACARRWALTALGIGRLAPEARAYVYALESVLTPRAYAAGQAALRRMRTIGARSVNSPCA